MVGTKAFKNVEGVAEEGRHPLLRVVEAANLLDFLLTIASSCRSKESDDCCKQNVLANVECVG